MSHFRTPSGSHIRLLQRFVLILSLTIVSMADAPFTIRFPGR